MQIGHRGYNKQVGLQLKQWNHINGMYRARLAVSHLF